MTVILKSWVSKITGFYYWFNNYNSAFLKNSKSGKMSKVNQDYFHQHFKLPGHNGIGDWRVILSELIIGRSLETGKFLVAEI